MKKSLLVIIVIAGILAACTGQSPDASATETRTLTVMTHDSFAISEDVIAQFETENNVKVEFIRSGDTGAALNKAILSKDNPLADVFYGVDNTFLTRGWKAGSLNPISPHFSPRCRKNSNLILATLPCQLIMVMSASTMTKPISKKTV